MANAQAQLHCDAVEHLKRYHTHALQQQKVGAANAATAADAVAAHAHATAGANAAARAIADAAAAAIKGSSTPTPRMNWNLLTPEGKANQQSKRTQFVLLK